MYPTLHQKAALYLYNICQNHISTDGNKRTALNAMDTFIRLNGYSLKKELTPIAKRKMISIIPNTGNTRNAVLEEFIIDVASAQVSLDEITNWLELNIEKLN
jgi:death-on-curing family protein